jgi:hypothetical protein
VSVFTAGILDMLRQAGSYTDQQLSRIGDRVAILVGAILPSVLVWA